MRRFSWALLPLLDGCVLMDFTASAVGASTSGWFETGVVRKPREEVVQTTRDLVVRHGYTIQNFDPRAPRFQTEWDVHLSSHWHEGYRTNLEVEFLPVEGGGTNVRVRSTREVNEESEHPMSADRAVWTTAGVDEKQKQRIAEPAMRLHQTLKFKFFGISND